MASFDIKKSAEDIADVFVSFFEQFLSILTTPENYFERLFSLAFTQSTRLKKAVLFTATSILLGVALARFLKLPDSPDSVNPEIAIAVLFVWILTAIILHPILRIFTSKGVLQDTIVVFLLVISSLHLVFIPLLAVTGRFLTETKVTLTYDYVVYFGATSRHEKLGGMGMEAIIPRITSGNISEKYTEFFIKEINPDKDNTFLPPAKSLSSYSDIEDIPTNPNSIQRIPLLPDSKKPARRETPVLKQGIDWLLLSLWGIYYIINSAYLAIGLSIPHNKKPILLFGLAMFGPIALAIFTTVLLNMFLFFIAL